jgi:hypothetical protein
VTRVVAIILHPTAEPDAGPLTGVLAAIRLRNAEAGADGFRRVGAEAAIVAGPPDGVPFGRRLREAVERLRPDGAVILGSGAIPLASAADRRMFVTAAAGTGRRALANNRYSADVVAIPGIAAAIDGLPDLASDNALPRWLEASAGLAVDDLRRRWRLQVDLDSPLDAILTGMGVGAIPGERVTAVLAALRLVAADPARELVVSGRTSAAAIAWLERHAAARTRAIVEERGLRTRVAGQRPARSVLGLVLDGVGPEALGTILAGLGDAAIVDSRVLLAHRCGADESGWPIAEDRFASDLLLTEQVADPWLRALTRSAAEAPIPIVLGGHSLVGPGLRLALAPR